MLSCGTWIKHQKHEEAQPAATAQRLEGTRFEFGVANSAWLTRDRSAKMKLTHIVVALLASVVVASAEISVWDVSQDGKRYSHIIGEDRAAKLPNYDPQKAEPPVLPTKACQIAESYLKRKFPKISGFVVDSITLQFSTTTDPHIWHYFIQFIPEKSSPWDATLEHAVVVLLDGSVVEPIILKEDEEKANQTLQPTAASGRG